MGCVGRKFAHQQYNEYKNEVFCVEIDGTEILGSRQKGKNGNCKKFPRKGTKPKTVQPTQPALCMRKRRQAVRAKSAYVPVCKGRDFDVKQCVGKWCWCASAEGDVVPITFHRKGSPKPPNCAGHRAFKFSCKGKKGTQPHPTGREAPNRPTALGIELSNSAAKARKARSLIPQTAHDTFSAQKSAHSTAVVSAA